MFPNEQPSTQAPYTNPPSPDMATATAGIANGVRTQAAQAQDTPVSRAVKGQLSEEADVLLAMQGIVNGDPVGMEMYDMGFFEDGTPALRINNTPIPIDMQTWMSMVSMRERTREDIRARVIHERKVMETQTALDNAIKAMPKLPQESRDVLNAMKNDYPEWAAQQIARLAFNLEGDGGLTQQIELGAEFQNYMGGNWNKRKGSPRKQFVPISERIQRGMAPDQEYLNMPSELESAQMDAMSNGDLDMHAALNVMPWFAQIGAQARVARAQRGMMTAGIFDICADFDQNRNTASSLLGRLMLAASNGSVNGADNVPIPSQMTNAAEALPYLTKLQQWAQRNWGYSDNDPKSLESAAMYVLWFVNNKNNTQQMVQPAANPSSNQVAPAASPAPQGSSQQPARRSSGVSN